jgi:hypothetical protein
MRLDRKLSSVSIALAIVLLTLSLSTVYARSKTRSNEVELNPTSGSLTPSSSGTVEWSFSSGVLSGKFDVEDLPAQGSHLAYGMWFVNTDTGDKAFLGLLVTEEETTILFLQNSNGEATFSAAKLTAGPNAGSPITLASDGNNLFILLVEKSVDFANPSPVGSSVSGTF